MKARAARGQSRPEQPILVDTTAGARDRISESACSEPVASMKNAANRRTIVGQEIAQTRPLWRRAQFHDLAERMDGRGSDVACPALQQVDASLDVRRSQKVVSVKTADVFSPSLADAKIAVRPRSPGLGLKQDANARPDQRGRNKPRPDIAGTAVNDYDLNISKCLRTNGLDRFLEKGAIVDADKYYGNQGQSLGPWAVRKTCEQRRHTTSLIEQRMANGRTIAGSRLSRIEIVARSLRHDRIDLTIPLLGDQIALPSRGVVDLTALGPLDNPIAHRGNISQGEPRRKKLRQDINNFIRQNHTLCARPTGQLASCFHKRSKCRIACCFRLLSPLRFWPTPHILEVDFVDCLRLARTVASPGFYIFVCGLVGGYSVHRRCLQYKEQPPDWGEYRSQRLFKRRGRLRVPAQPGREMRRRIGGSAVMAYLRPSELEALGLRSYGVDVRISDRASIYNPSLISLGNHVRIDDFCILSAGSGGINIGDYIHVAAYTSLIGAGRISIGDFANLSSRVSIYSSSDDYSGATMTNPTVHDDYKNVEVAEVNIGRHVIIGCGSIVLPGVTLGEGVAVGALSLVKKDCPPFGIYSGAPARLRGERLRNVLQLEERFLADRARQG